MQAAFDHGLSDGRVAILIDGKKCTAKNKTKEFIFLPYIFLPCGFFAKAPVNA